MRKVRWFLLALTMAMTAAVGQPVQQDALSLRQARACPEIPPDCCWVVTFHGCLVCRATC